MEINPDVAKAAITAIERLSKNGTKAQCEHFTKMLTLLADCYAPNSENRAVLIVHTDDALHTISVNADAWEAAGLVQMCHDNMDLKAFNKMPDQYLAH